MTDAVKTTTDESANSPRTAARDDTTASVRGIGATTLSNSHRQRTKPCARFDVYDFAIPRGATEPVTLKQTAEKVWEPKLLAEIVAGRDPRVAPTTPKHDGVVTVADFLDQYFTNYVEAEGLKTADTVRGHIKQLKEVLGELPVTALEKPADIARFKAHYRKGRTLATVNRVLGVLRAAVNWGRFQDPPCSQPRRSIASASASSDGTRPSGTGESIATRSNGSLQRASR